MGPATDKHQAPTHQLKLYVKAVIEFEAWPIVVKSTAALRKEVVGINMRRNIFKLSD